MDEEGGREFGLRWRVRAEQDEEGVDTGQPAGNVGALGRVSAAPPQVMWSG